MRYIFDTTAYSDLLCGDVAIAGLVQTADEIYVPQVVIAELRIGFKLGSRQLENERLLARFLATSKVRILLPDNATTDYFVDLAVYARQKGVQLSVHDLWIAALAWQHKIMLVSHDNDFKHLAHPDIKLWQ